MNRLYIASFLTLLTSCGERDKDQDVRGTLIGRHYTNDVLGFALDIPADWDTLASERYFNNPQWNPVLDSSIMNRDQLHVKYTSLLDLERGASSDSAYCAIGILVEDLSVVRSAREYFAYSERLVGKAPASYPKWEFSDPIADSTIGGRNFSVQFVNVWTSSTVGATRVTYCREIQDKLLVFTVTDCVNKEAFGKAQKLLRSVKWIE